MPKSVSFSAMSAEELEEKFREITSFRPTMGIIFSSVSVVVGDISRIISQLKVPVFGCTTNGEILVEETEDPFHTDSAVCCFLDFEPELFRIRLFERGKGNSHDLGKRIGKWGKREFSSPAFLVVISGLANDGEAIVRGITDGAGERVHIFGGLAGDDSHLVDTQVFTHTGISHDGAAVLLFDSGKIDITGVASSGWTGIGADLKITSSEGNIVYTINGRKAADVFSEYLDLKEGDARDLVLNFPLLVKRPDGSEVPRTVLTLDFVKGSLTFAGTVPEGALVRFSSSFGHQTIDEAIREMETFHASKSSASLLLLFSCIARYRVAGAIAGEEVLAASRLWSAPLIGFFTYGEIGQNNAGNSDFFNETLSLALVSRRDTSA